MKYVGAVLFALLALASAGQWSAGGGGAFAFLAGVSLIYSITLFVEARR